MNLFAGHKLAQDFEKLIVTKGNRLKRAIEWGLAWKCPKFRL